MLLKNLTQRRVTGAAGLLVLSLLAIGIGCKKAAQTEGNETSSGGQTAWQAPDFLLYDLDNKPVKLSDFAGKTVILDFWATWCPPCREEIPHFKQLYKKYGERGLVVIGISLDEGGIQGVKEFAAKFAINYPIVMGNETVTQDYGGIQGIPTTFVIDKNRKIVKKAVGYRDLEFFESLITGIL